MATETDDDLVLLSVMIPRALRTAIDDWGAEQDGGLNRTRATRVLLRDGLEARGAGKPRKRAAGVR